MCRGHRLLTCFPRPARHPWISQPPRSLTSSLLRLGRLLAHHREARGDCVLPCCDTTPIASSQRQTAIRICDLASYTSHACSMRFGLPRRTGSAGTQLAREARRVTCSSAMTARFTARLPQAIFAVSPLTGSLACANRTGPGWTLHYRQ